MVNRYIDFLFSLHKFGIKPGLERTRRFLTYLGNPQKQFATVLVGGTNGKGTTAAFLTSILQEAGYKVGLFTSPHLVRFNERIRTGRDNFIDNKYIANFLKENQKFIETEKMSFFETSTGLALNWFANEKIDIAILEVGLGGRYDATNVVEPLFSVITGVSLDHTERLGRTLKQILDDKLGIVRHGKELIISGVSGKLIKSFEDFFHKNNVIALNAGKLRSKTISMNLSGSKHQIANLTVDTQLTGFHIRNLLKICLLSKQVLDKYGYSISDADFLEGIRKTDWPGRFQVISSSPLVILDVAHNPASAANLARNLWTLVGKPMTIVLGMMRDKDHRGVIRRLEPVADRFIFVRPNTPRAVKPQVLSSIPRKESLVIEDVSSALSYAVSRFERLLVTGSHYTVGEAFRLFNVR